MGGGSVPGFVDGTVAPQTIDPGTLALTGTLPPGVIGLDAGGGTRPSPGVIGDKVVAFAQQHSGQKVGDGECFALVDQALRGAGAKSAADFGTVVPDADYVWGTATTVADAKPGDIIQFRDYRYDREITVEQADGASSTRTEFQERPHHTAIVASVDGNGAITVLEQNAPERSATHRTQLFFLDRNDKSGGTTTKINVSGRFTIYRPQSR
jgi:hypothetical protein